MEFHYKKSSGLSLQDALSLEWLETNGCGGYASSTILNGHTRKYHGLLVSHLKEPAGEFVLVSQLEDVIRCGDQQYALTAHQYPGVVCDGSFSAYQEFTLDTHPCILYRFEEKQFTLSKEWLMVQGEDTLLVRYQLLEGTPLELSFRPLLACRNFHKLTRENSELQGSSVECVQGKKVTPYPTMPSLFFQTNVNAIQENALGVWYKNFEYSKEKERGYDYQEDLFSPFEWVVPLKTDQAIVIALSTQEQNAALLEEKWKKEIASRKRLAKKLTGSSFQKQLKKTGLSFICRDPSTESTSVKAGYHWFSEWGRDTMISIPGLMLCTGLETVAMDTLKTYARYEQQGLLPNMLSGKLEKDAYNSVDASLWFGWAVQEYYSKTRDLKSIAKYFWPTLKSIFSHYKSGTLFNIKAQENGLLYAGSRETNLTWMDVKMGNVPFSPRYGMAVEINALWFNFLYFINLLAKHLHDPIMQEINPLIQSLGSAFRETFWDEELGYLRDCVNADGIDMSIRPNQIIAASLPYSPLTKKMAAKVVQVVQDHLLTPYGLRTLSPQDPRYFGHYDGGPQTRDMAYHHGSVWPWLLGHFGAALIRVSVNKKDVMKVLGPCLKALETHLGEVGIGCISEVFDGDAPHRPNGCISQAWNIAEVLRLTYLIKD